MTAPLPLRLRRAYQRDHAAAFRPFRLLGITAGMVHGAMMVAGFARFNQWLT